MFDLAGPAPVLVGVAVLSVPASQPVLTSVFPHLEPFLNQAAPSTHWCCLPGRLPMGWLLTPHRLTGPCRPGICAKLSAAVWSAGGRRMARRPLQRVAGFLVADAPVCCRTPTRRGAAADRAVRAAGRVHKIRFCEVLGVPRDRAGVRRAPRRRIPAASLDGREGCDICQHVPVGVIEGQPGQLDPVCGCEDEVLSSPDDCGYQPPGRAVG
jgi:hypothetical protein